MVTKSEGIAGRGEGWTRREGRFIVKAETGLMRIGKGGSNSAHQGREFLDRYPGTIFLNMVVRTHLHSNTVRMDKGADHLLHFRHGCAPPYTGSPAHRRHPGSFTTLNGHHRFTNCHRWESGNQAIRQTGHSQIGISDLAESNRTKIKILDLGVLVSGSLHAQAADSSPYPPLVAYHTDLPELSKNPQQGPVFRHLRRRRWWECRA
jgi:hypothetical protein